MVDVPNVTSLSETFDENRLGTAEPVELGEPRSVPAVSVPTGCREVGGSPFGAGWNTRRECRDDKDEATTGPVKRYSYAGPPKINVSTWNERPKRQVSIKTDQDYVTGIRQRLQQKAAAGGVCAAPRDGVVAAAGSSEPGDGVRTNDKPTVSRVPIVKSVELKKPYAERLRTVSPVLALSDVIRAQAKLSNGYGGYRGSVVVLTAGDDNGDDGQIVVPTAVAAESPERKSFTFGKLMMTNRTGRRPREISPNVDPRQSLLESIRTFGGRDNLRKIRA